MKNGIGIIGTKVGMTQVFMEDGVLVPVTAIHIEPNTVIAHKTDEKDGYVSVQVGAGAIREKLVTKARAGQFKASGVVPTRHLMEFRLSEIPENLAVGQSYGIEFCKDMASIDVTGTSKGKGFAGVMKRHHMAGFPGSRGTHEYFRHGGSIGMRARPGKVLKGKRMAGQMGNETSTTINLRVIRVDEENKLLLVRGAVPGPKGGMVVFHQSFRKPMALHGVSGAQVEEASKNPMKASKAGAKGAPKKK
jgi:large subunit ribosomal protein L3